MRRKLMPDSNNLFHKLSPTKDKSQYELFHEWLNNCPTQIEDYQDNIDSVTIRFDTPFAEAK